MQHDEHLADIAKAALLPTLGLNVTPDEGKTLETVVERVRAAIEKRNTAPIMLKKERDKQQVIQRK